MFVQNEGEKKRQKMDMLIKRTPKIWDILLGCEHSCSVFSTYVGEFCVQFTRNFH